MRYTIRLSANAERDLAQLPAHVQKRILRCLDRLADDPRRPPSCQLQGQPHLRRVHASKDYVIIYSVLDLEVVVLVVRVGHRRDIYRNM